MKNTVTLLIILLYTHVSSLHADADCLDNSHYLDTCVDYKELYEVETCLCPCEKKYKLLPGRGQCPKCKHYRKVRSLEIISTQKRCPTD
jgi:hypothetical protein